MRVVLASASPRRRELLARLAYPFEVIPADVDETRLPGEVADAYVRRVADDKARRVSAAQAHGTAVLAADTAVVIDGDVLGKPADAREARAMLARLSGREHEVLTAVVWAMDGEARQAAMTRSRVRFRALGDREIDDYVATGDPLDKAGSYGIQAGAASFVERVSGSLTGVIGLPLEETERLARRLGVPEPAPPLPPDAVRLRWCAVASEVAGLAVGCGRQAASARVVAVSKGQPAALLQAAIAAGASDLGENYVQEAAAKRAALADAAPETSAARWHLIGPLQRNKARLAAATFDLVHTIHRPDVARALVERAGGCGVRALVQVNVTRDPAKSGVLPEAARELVRELSAIDGLSLDGLMTIGPADDGAAAARAAFEELHALLDGLRAMGYERLHELSMGMSGDYPAAIEAGATLLRIGTAVFGPRLAVTR